MLIISPSVLASDFSRLGDDVKKVHKAGAEYIHLDVMDGIFVPNISFGPPVISSLRKVTDIVFDVHLMITEPQRYIKDYVDAGADIITIHYESCKDPAEVVKLIKSYGVRAAVSIKPATSPEVLFPMMAELDMVLVMTVEPGFGGQKMIPETIDKVRILREYANANGLDTDIEVDGGITAENLKYATAAGANVIVAGSAIFKADDPAKVISDMMKVGDRYPFGADTQK
ncbi:MAG: ribulose-phosphate 3-epimerase [Clostridia bacterium]|nr:ribulose-phosphate 3-epimerase [Clostridia bacterium]